MIKAVLRQGAVTRDIFMLFSNRDRARRYRLGDQDAALSRLKHGFESRYRYHVQLGSLVSGSGFLAPIV